MADLNENNNVESETECPDFNFIYADTELCQFEIAQLYSYTENHEFHINAKSFERKMENFNNKSKIWKEMEVSEHKCIIMRLMNDLELSQKNIRMEAARSLLYIAQGCWFELETVTDQINWARKNSILLYNLGVFTAFVDLLNLEVESSSNGLKKIAISISDSEDLRIILSVLYTITEVIRVEKEQNTDEYREVYENFSEDISHEIISTKLLEMITSFCSGTSPHFPIKKILLLLWKISLISLGGMDRLRLMKNESRVEAGLKAMTEDTLEIAKTMRPSTPPSIGDGLSNQNFKRDRNFRRVGKNDFLQLEKQNAEDLCDESSEDNEEDMPEYDDPEGPFSPISPMPQTSSRLPWTPKVRQKDIDQFLNYSRSKFIGFTIPGDVDNLVGLPQPIHESVKTLRRHIYTSLSEIQIKKEIEIARNPLSASKNEITVQTPAELLYQSILPKLPQYIIALLKILLAAAPTSKAKNESINILADILPEGTPVTVTESTKLGIDVNRHKEIIVKTVSAILLLYLKHFKLNHIYQFEFMSQHLVFANCIPLILKFFNQNIMHYVGSRNNIQKMDFPFCVIGEQPELTFGVIEDSTSSSRNIFSCINLLRVLNKLTKWKNSRVMMLVVFKSAPILKKTLKVRHAMMQLYVLKLFKMQMKYLGRQWRKSNMKIISAIYNKVRHRLNDDWAFGNELDARPWDFQAEESTLRTSVDNFNARRYLISNTSNTVTSINGGNDQIGTNFDFLQQNLNANGEEDEQLGRWDENIELSEEFKQNNESWLQEQVFNVEIDWNSLLLTVE